MNLVRSFGGRFFVQHDLNKHVEGIMYVSQIDLAFDHLPEASTPTADAQKV
jgi:hypothetical protein